MTPIVFCLQPTAHDISDVKRYGEIRFIFGDHRPSVFDDARFKEAVWKRFEDAEFDPHLDYVAFYGTAVPCVLVTGYLVEKYGGFNALLFNATTQKYLHRRIGR